MIEYLGVGYKSLSALCHALNISYYRTLMRMRRGQCIEDAVRDDVTRGNSCTDHLGNEYTSAVEMCKHYNISCNLYNVRRRRGMSVEDALTSPCAHAGVYVTKSGKHCVDHLGNEYESIVAMCRYYNVSYSAFTNRLKRGWSVERALTSNHSNL